MDSNIMKFKCVLHYDDQHQGVIMYNDLTYSGLVGLVLKKFNLDPNIPMNLSCKLASFNYRIDITEDDEVMFFVECACDATAGVAQLYVVQPNK